MRERSTRFGFNPRARIGANVGRLEKLHGVRVSIHAPVWARTCVTSNSNCSSFTFQPTRPPGREPPAHVVVRLHDLVSIHALPRARTGNLGQVSGLIVVSIHRTRTARTIRALVIDHHSPVSTHAQQRIVTEQWCFNPRASHGRERARAAGESRGSSGFNPRARMGANAAQIQEVRGVRSKLCKSSAIIKSFHSHVRKL
jgi:hypothetical protein